jgi:hypothetical protein
VLCHACAPRSADELDSCADAQLLCELSVRIPGPLELDHAAHVHMATQILHS